MEDQPRGENKWISPETDPELQKLFELCYEELRRRAAGQLLAERPNHTVTATALVHESFLRMAASKVPAQDEQHFLRLVQKNMRQFLIDYARQRNAEKRPTSGSRVALDDCGVTVDDIHSENFGDLEEVFKRLESADGVAARIVEMRYFGGLTQEECAREMQLSSRTIQRKWEAARAFLRSELDHR